MTEIGTLKAAEADLHHRARHDLMTGLLNKVAFVEVVTGADDPAQIAAWLQSIGQSKVDGRTKALHEQLPVGTTITVTNGSVTLS